MTIFFLFYTFEKISYYHSHGKPVIITRIIMLIFRKTGHKHLSLGSQNFGVSGWIQNRCISRNKNFQNE